MRLSSILFYLILFASTLNAVGQSNNIFNRIDHEYGLKIIVGKSRPTVLNRNYPSFQPNKGEVIFSSSPLLALRLNYSKSFKFNPKLMWDIGLEAGVDSYRLNFKASQEFADIGWSIPYFSEVTSFDMVYSSTILSIRYNLPISESSAFSFKAGSRFTFFIPTGIGLELGVILNSGESRTLFLMNIDSNNSNTLIIAPDLTFEYYYAKPKSKFGFSLGLNTSFSRKIYANGTYTIFGDREVLRGDVSKKPIFLALNMGVSYLLEK